MISPTILRRAGLWHSPAGSFFLTVVALGAAITLWKLDTATAVDSPAQPDPVAAGTASENLAPSYGRLPAAFERNVGQTVPQVKFLSRCAGATLFLTSSEAVLASNAGGLPRLARELRMTMLGANPSAEAIGLDELPGKTNYFLGNDRGKWRTNVPTYARVKFRKVYPGIDLLYRDNHGRLEYDFRVRPGAAIGKIRLAFPDASSLKLDERGALLLQLGGSVLLFEAPSLYQEIAGRKVRLEGRFVIRANQAVGFAAVGYDRSQPLTIDPVLVYSTWLGGIGADRGVAVAVDAAGNAYITGSTTSPNFPGAHPTSPRSGPDPEQPNVFVAKINRTGSALLYFTYLGGSKSDGGIGIAIDSAGHAYVTGFTVSPDFPIVASVQSRHGGGYDAFVAKLNSSGSELLYSTFLGGDGGESGGGIAVDSSGSAYVTGYTGSRNFPTFHPLQGSLKGPFDVFICKLSPDGRHLIYSTFLGGSNSDEGVAIAVDSGGNAYVTGSVTSSDFPTLNPIQSKFGGGVVDAFVLKLNAEGSALVYSTYLGGSYRDQGAGIAVDPSGNAYVTGFTGSTDFPVSHAIQPELAGEFDAFVAKLNFTGSDLLYSTYLGGSGDDKGAAIAVDRSGNAFVTGFTGSLNFPVVGPIQPQFGGATDVFVSRLNAAGSVLQFSSFLGGTADDQGAGIAVDSSDNAYVTGYTASPNFPVAHPLQTSFAGIEDAFLAKIGKTRASHPRK